MLKEQDIQQIRDIIAKELESLLSLDRYTFQKHLQIFDARNIQLGRTNGTKIGTDTDQLIGFFGTTPVDQPATVSDPNGGATVDASAREKIEQLIDRLQELGLIA